MVVPLVGIKINIAKGNKRKRNVNSIEGTVISRVCRAIVIKDDDGFKAKINLDKDNNSDILLVPFTTKSYDIKGREIIFSKERIDNGRHRCIIRDKLKANTYNDVENYIPFRENIVITGDILRIDGKMYFRYREFISFSPFVEDYNPCLTREDKPLFKK
jgi:hypothetical protein